MMRPIDADALIEKCGGWYVDECTESGFIGTLENLLATEPTIQPVATDTNVGDKISRQEAIDELPYLLDYDGLKGENGFVSKRLVRKMLKELPPAQPEPPWIPVSERLPEKGGEYLVSVHHTIGAISVFHPEKDTYVDDVAIMKYYGKFPSTVRAWMPLPEPYKPNK